MRSQHVSLTPPQRGTPRNCGIFRSTPAVPASPPTHPDRNRTVQRRSVRLTATQSRRREDHRATWLSDAPLRTPNTSRPLPQPHFCPLCPPTRREISATTVSQLLSHLRTTHCARSVAGKPRSSQLRALSSVLERAGYWYCPTHDKFLGTNVGPCTSQGLFPFTYAKCPRCSIQSSPPTYHPLDRTQLAPPQNPTGPNVAPEGDPPPPPSSQTQREQSVISQPLPTPEDIFTTHIPLISHIPTRHLPAIAESFRTTFQRAIDATEANSETASDEFLKIFLFPSVILTNSSSDSLDSGSGSESSDTPTGRDVYKRRIQLWEDGHYQTLWSEAVRNASSRSGRALSPQEQGEANIKRCLRLAKEGAYSKAVQALQSDGVAPASPETSQALREKHPQETPSDDTAQYTRPEIRPRFIPFSVDQVLCAVRKFRAGAAGGGSGLRPNHLDELLRAPYSNPSHSLRKEDTRLVNMLASGSAPRPLSPWIAGAPLTALAKRGSGIRPIAVGETIRRLVSSCCMARVGKKAARLLRPLQIGIATKTGGEATVHAKRRLYQRYHDNSKYALLAVDLKNAFNLCSRNAFLERTKNMFPEILAWVEYCYASHAAFLWTGYDMLRSVVGVQQGDSLGPLLFALALHQLLEKIKQLVSTGHPQDTEMAELLLQLCYLDDGYIIASHEILRPTLDLLSSHEATSQGLYLSVRKCSIWWPTPPPQHVQDLYPNEIPQSYNEGTLILQAPVGSHTFMEDHM